jgi:hypothetical protein
VACGEEKRGRKTRARAVLTQETMMDGVIALMGRQSG